MDGLAHCSEMDILATRWTDGYLGYRACADVRSSQAASTNCQFNNQEPGTWSCLRLEIPEILGFGLINLRSTYGVLLQTPCY